MLRYYAHIAVDLAVPEWKASLLTQILGLINKSASKASPVKLLKTNHIKIPYEAGDAPQILKHPGVWQYMSPATGEVMVIPTRANPHIHIVAEKPEFGYARFLIAMELGDSAKHISVHESSPEIFSFMGSSMFFNEFLYNSNVFI